MLYLHLKKGMISTKVWIGIMMVVLVCTLPGVMMMMQESNSTTAEIVFQGKVIDTIQLDRVTEAFTISLSGDAGESVISVAPGQICVSAADCPDQVCVKHGLLKSEAAPIVCLPNELVIRLLPKESIKDNVTIDGVSE